MPYASAADTTNFVQPDGRVEGLNVAASGSFRFWDYDGPLGITVGTGFSIDADGALIVGLEDGDWGSTIAFDASIAVGFDGTLEVELRDGFVPTPGYYQWQLFDFTGVSPTGGFSTYVLPVVAGNAWNTTTLMSDGILRLFVAPPGDANYDGTVDADDGAILAANWQKMSGATWGDGDFNGDNRVDDLDATIMAANWGQTVFPAAAVPEPGAIALLLIGSLTCLIRRRARI